jgi:hypothetical protein
VAEAAKTLHLVAADLLSAQVSAGDDRRSPMPTITFNILREEKTHDTNAADPA